MAEHLQARAKKHQFGYRLSVLSDVGRRRSENQDAYGYAISSQAALYIVADGMGGARGGATASAIAVNHIIDHAFNESKAVDMESLRAAIAGSNGVIFSRSQEDPNLFGMGTTVASVLISGETATLAHVGDSRVYFLKNGELKQLTRDHTLVQELVDTGTIAETDAAAHPIAHMLTRSLGPTEIIGVETRVLETPLSGGERFLICSDGLYNHVSFDQIRSILGDGSPETATKNLIKYALDGGGSDNVTALVVEIAADPTSSGLIAIPSGGELTRVTSREFPKPESHESDSDAKYTNGAVGGAGNDHHETTGFLRAEDLANYAASRAASGGDSQQGLQAETKSFQGSYALLVLVLGVAAGILFFGRGRGGDLDPVEVASTGRPNATATAAPGRTPAAVETPVPLLPPAETPQAVAADTPVPTPIATAVATPAVVAPTPVPQASEVPLLIQPEETSTPPPAPSLAPTASPTSAASSEPTPEGTPEPLSTAQAESALVGLSNLDGVNGIPPEVVNQAFAMDIPSPPRIAETELEKIPELGVNTPIIWEHESQRMARILVEDRARRVNESPQEIRNGSAPGLKTKIFAPEELQSAAAEKEALRRRVAELDGKISLLMVADKAAAKKIEKETEEKISSLRKEIQKKQVESAKWNQALQSWRLVKNQSTSTDTVQLASIAGKFSVPIREALASFQKSSDSYTQSLSKWQNQPLDTQATAMLAQLGRDAKAARLELENRVRSEVNRGWLEADEQAVRARIELFGLERQKELQVKYAGYVRGFTPVTGASRLSLYRKYLSERGATLKKLKAKQQMLDDEAEVKFRIQQFSKQPSP